MEAFPVGSHVVIELMDERKVAGYIRGYSDDGLLLSATHKDAVMVRKVSAGMSKSIAEQLAEKNGLWLRSAMALRGHFRGVVAGRDAIVAQLQWDVEQDLLEQSDDGMQFRELSAPVLTFVSGGAIMLMEDTDDKIQEAEVSLFDQTLDVALEQILTDGEETTEDEEEENGVKPETEGTA